MVATDKSTATELGISATPAFIVNGKRMVGNRGVPAMRDLVDQALAER